MVKNRFLRFTLFSLVWLSLSLASPAQMVEIPDPNLRAAVETALGKAPGDTITAPDMANLTRLEARNANISDLTGLEHATNLTELFLGDEYVEAEDRWMNSNSVKDLSPLAGLTSLIRLGLRNNNISNILAVEGLTNLTWLNLWHNNISDIYALVDLTSLKELSLGGNTISDISVLAGLTQLERLELWGNSTTDISSVAGLTNLTSLGLNDNNISDISPLVTNTGLGKGDTVDVRQNRLSDQSLYTHIPVLQNRGVTVEFDNRTPTTLLNISGMIAELNNLLIVEVRDNNNRALAGVRVTFTVTSGSGMLSTTRTTTNENGRAQSQFTLGSDGVPNTVSASVEGISEPVTFVEVPFVNIPFDVNNIPEPVPPPKEVRDFFELDPFYQQWINVGGFPVLTSAEVSPYAVKEAAWTIWHMVGHRPDILRAMAQNKARLSIVPNNKHISDIPEYDFGRLDFFWDIRARGVGGHTTTSAEGSIICRDSNECWGELIHEFAHQIHHWGLNQIDAMFDSRLETLYDEALKEGLYQNRYAGSNRDEYWAEGVGSWFDGLSSNNVAHTEALKEYDPRLATLLTEVFGDGSWRYTPPSTRTHLPHLQGFNLQEAPIYQRPPELLELEKQLWDPNSDGGGRWVNLKLYDPRGLSHLKKLATGGNHTDFLFGNLTGTNLALYSFNADGKKILHDYSTTPDFVHVITEVGAIWLIQDRTGQDLAVFRAEEKIGRVLVTPTPFLITSGLSKVSGDNQSGVSGTVLQSPLVVEVRDENLSTLEGISVTFTVTTGNGTLSVTRTTTDENGRAESTFILGPNTGRTTVEVSAVGIVPPVIFNAVAEAAIDIPDTNLRAAVEAALSKTTGDSITPSEMATLTRLEVRNANISDLTGLEHATNLTELFLDEEYVEAEDRWMNSNSVKDLSPLAGLTSLIKLGLRKNNISNISAVAGLTNLIWLDLNNNNISDISALVDLTNLTWLNLWHNNISAIYALVDLTSLKELSLGGNTISDISVLAGLTQLERLELWGNSTTDISSVAGLTNLTSLGLNDNNISDISPLVANTGLGKGDKVYVRWNPLSYQSIHTHIPALQQRGVMVEFDNRPHPAFLKISGDNQKGASFTPLSQPFVVEAQDANGSALAGVSVTFAVTAGGGTLSTTITRTDENGRAQSTLTLGPNLGTNTVEVSAAGIEVPATFHAISDTEAPSIAADVNGDGVVNVLDLIVIASELGNTGTNLVVDVNRDGIVSILDLILVAGMFDDAAAAPSAQPQVPETLTAVEVQDWLTDARAIEVRDPIVKRGIIMLEQLLISLTPKETELLANYPNPFNPETWIPYRLAEDAFVTLTIYDGSGQVVRTLDVGHRIASAYESQSKAIHWDGRNNVGGRVASGVYFYHLSAGDFSATRKMLILK